MQGSRLSFRGSLLSNILLFCFSSHLINSPQKGIKACSAADKLRAVEMAADFPKEYGGKNRNKAYSQELKKQSREKPFIISAGSYEKKHLLSYFN